MTEDRRRHAAPRGSRAPHARTPIRTRAGAPSHRPSRAPCGAGRRSCRCRAESHRAGALDRLSDPARTEGHQWLGARRGHRSGTAPAAPRRCRSCRPQPLPSCRIGAAGPRPGSASRASPSSWGHLRVLGLHVPPDVYEVALAETAGARGNTLLQIGEAGFDTISGRNRLIPISPSLFKNFAQRPYVTLRMTVWAVEDYFIVAEVSLKCLRECEWRSAGGALLHAELDTLHRDCTSHGFSSLSRSEVVRSVSFQKARRKTVTTSPTMHPRSTGVMA